MGSTPTNTPAPAPTPAPKTNRIGLQVIDYRGGKTTLCAGCGHNAISERIIDAMYEMGVQPERVAKLSGIGCSSKSPAYFMNRAHSFNSVHGRMPSVATGAMLANKNLIALGVTGDGDTVSIGQWLLRSDERPVFRDRRSGINAEKWRRERPSSC